MRRRDWREADDREVLEDRLGRWAGTTSGCSSRCSRRRTFTTPARSSGSTRPRSAAGSGAAERAIGARLFARTRDGLRPTAAAERLRPHAEAMQAEAAEVVRAAAAATTRASGVVRVATTEALARMLVAEGLLDVRRDHPDIDLELFGSNAPVDSPAAKRTSPFA